jgi:hypothetical protein
MERQRNSMVHYAGAFMDKDKGTKQPLSLALCFIVLSRVNRDRSIRSKGMAHSRTARSQIEMDDQVKH